MLWPSPDCALSYPELAPSLLDHTVGTQDPVQMASSQHGFFLGSIFKGQTLLTQTVHKVLLSEAGEDVWIEFGWDFRSPYHGMQGSSSQEQSQGKRGEAWLRVRASFLSVTTFLYQGI